MKPLNVVVRLIRTLQLLACITKCTYGIIYELFVFIVNKFLERAEIINCLKHWFPLIFFCHALYSNGDCNWF